MISYTSRRRISSFAAAAIISTHMSLMASAFCNNPSQNVLGASRLVTNNNIHATIYQHQIDNNRKHHHQKFMSTLFMSEGGAKFEKIDEDDDQVIAFMETSGDKGIDCYIDSYANVDGVEYTIGSPCDYCVALCYFDGDDQLVPIELDDELMDDIFPIAEEIIEDEFGEELVLLRTPQTLTLVGVSMLCLCVCVS